MSRREKTRVRTRPDAGLIHLLNQRYRQEWERAEALHGELERLRRSPLAPLIAALKWLKRRVRRPNKKPTLTERATPYIAPTTAPEPTGLVSIIIPFRDQPELLRNCLRSLKWSAYHRFELILVNNGSTDPRTRRLLDRIGERTRIKIVDVPETFNFSKLCNAGAARASGEFLLFLNNDIEALTSDWLERMLRIAVDPTVGIVGATLLYPDRTIQHVGVFPRSNREWIHPHRGEPSHIRGDDGELQRVRCVPAVTGACLLVKRTLFSELGGFDERYPLTFNDVDLCRRVRQRGLSIVITPHARLFHYECLTRGYSP